MIRLWLHDRSIHTQRAYRHDIAQFLKYVRRPLSEVTLRALQDFADSLDALADTSRGRRLAAIKSLLTFAHKIGYLPFNVGVALELPPVEDKLAERIMTEGEVLCMIHGEKGARNHAMLRLLYVSGVRISELCGLCWRHVQPNEQGGQNTVFGKGRKTRAIRLTASAWEALGKLRRENAAPDDPVFRSRLGGALDPSQVRRIVYAAARRAGLASKVSPHWFRHAMHTQVYGGYRRATLPGCFAWYRPVTRMPKASRSRTSIRTFAASPARTCAASAADTPSSHRDGR